MSGVNEKTADRMADLCGVSIRSGQNRKFCGNLSMTVEEVPFRKVDCHTLWKKLKPGKYQMWYSFYTTEIGKERKAAIEDMRFERDGWLHIEPWGGFWLN